MPTVTPRHPNESFDAMHSRFKRLVEKCGVMDDFHAHEFYEKKSSKRARAKAAAIKREQRRVAEGRRNRPSV